MDLLANLSDGFAFALSWNALFYCFVGVALGMLVGVLPGIGPLPAIAMLLPITFYIPPTEAIIMLAGIYYGGQYGGSTASILLNLPGTPAAAVVCLDGYPMSRQGRGGIALLMTTVASFVGGFIGILMVGGFAPVLAEFALRFGAAEYFSLMVLALVGAAAMSGGSIFRAVAMVVIGLILGIVGQDIISGERRFVFGVPDLADGISLVAIAMGLFGVSEVMTSARRSAGGVPKKFGFRSMLPTQEDAARSWQPILRGTGIGTVSGILPGAGAAMASFLSYAVERRVARQPERFGNGAIEGVVAPEAANNAAAQSSFIPTLTLGIPGDAVMAVMIGALMIHGISPGPGFIAGNPELFWGLVASFIIGNAILLVLNIPFIGLWVKLITIPYSILYPIILSLICIGVYSIRFSVFDIYITVIFGIIGYIMNLLRFPIAPLILSFILSPMMEENFRRALLISRGQWSTFYERPISAVILFFSFFVIVFIAAMSIRSIVSRKFHRCADRGESARDAQG